ncbi:DNA repair protein [Seohaeicola saemankumensis]|nr:DNA repair protein [Seohaeicola saemankumensis]MCA0870240.1 DNA repair protein [Seohaeicola saemankumensis]
MRLSYFLILLCALGTVLWTALSAAGIWPWLELPIGLAGQPYENGGKLVQIGLMVLALMLAFYLPAHARIAALEHSHRDFRISVTDVARAYHEAHAADRRGAFQLASEFDAVKERLAYLREHPDLGDLEPELLEVAAEMSHVSHELAKIYSDEKVDRARTFLKQRQQEVDRFNERLEDARIVVQELRQWCRDVDLEESVAKAQLQRVREELFELLPELSVQLQDPPEPGGTSHSVVPMTQKRPPD